MRIRVLALVAGLLTAAATMACTADSPLSGAQTATVTMRFLTPATVRSLVVEVTGPGISPAVFLNLPVGNDTVATGVLTLPAGSARRFVVTAVDTAGVDTHRADTTITLQAGANPNLAMRLEPLPSSLGITVTFGGVRLVVPDTSTRTLAVGDSTEIQAYAIRANGDTVPGDSLVWGSSNPAVAVVNLSGQVRALRTGATAIAVSAQGAAASIRVVVGQTDGPPVAPSLTNALSSNRSNRFAAGITLGAFGNPSVFSISAWVRPEVLVDSADIILDASHFGDRNWVIQRIAGQWAFTTLPFSLIPGQWQHLLITYNDGDMKVFVNGSLQAAGFRRIIWGSSNPTLFLGNWVSASVDGRRFHGAIDDLYISYDLQHTGNFSPPALLGAPTSSQLFGLWRFDEGSGTTTANSLGTNFPVGAMGWTSRPIP